MFGLRSLGSLLADSELRQLFGRVASRKIEADLKTVEANAELARRLADSRRGRGDGDLKRIVREHLEYYHMLFDLSYAFHQRLLQVLGDNDAVDEVEPASGALALDLRAPRGATVQAAFKISNTRAEAIQVACKSSSFVTDDGSELIAGTVTFAPPSAEIQAGSEQVFRATVLVGPDFQPGRTYFATFDADGIEAMKIVARLTIEQSEARAEAPATRAADRPPVPAPKLERRRRAVAAKPKPLVRPIDPAPGSIVK
jgi:hypothetical protein